MKRMRRDGDEEPLKLAKRRDSARSKHVNRRLHQARIVGSG
jgi:hypothetical protein